MSLRFRVNTLTRSPERCTWTRAPSNFHSTTAVPSAATASPAVAEVLASIGCTGVRTAIRAPSSVSAPPARARDATPTRSPSSMAARRTRSGSTPKASATASAMIPSSAP